MPSPLQKQSKKQHNCKVLVVCVNKGGTLSYVDMFAPNNKLLAESPKAGQEVTTLSRWTSSICASLIQLCAQNVRHGAWKHFLSMARA